MSVGEEEFLGERVEVRVQELSGCRDIDFSVVNTEVISVNGKGRDCESRQAKKGQSVRRICSYGLCCGYALR